MPQKLRQLMQKKWVNNLLTVLLFIGIYLAIRPFMQGDVAEGASPPIQADTLMGESIDLTHLQGQPVMVHFWATWCPICGLETASVESVAQDWKVLNIATQSGDDELLLDHARNNEMNPQHIINDEGGELFAHYGAKAVPATFFIHPDGHISTVEVGFTSEWGMRLRLWWLATFP